ncbi:uncharacterized protein [Elaeis guineensis]|uniref:Pentatricopeptide repeat-containing protein At2g06000 n=1 Tax=Elaeis guineensis var. tenera TaxID=51953 RepID=A0A6I9R3G0_ELAGV|nr:pentatricopeptide repeat-containing protein At2g06000 [Elaeis guineensis]
MLLRGPSYPNVLHHHLLLSRLHLATATATGPASDAPDLWIAKAIATAFLLSPSTASSGLAPFLPALSPSVAFAAVRRLPTAESALGLFQVTRSAFGVAHSATAYRFLVARLFRSGLHEAALKVFDQMASDGHSPDGPCLEFFANSFAEAGQLDAALKLLARASEFNCRVRCYTFNKFMNLLVGRNRAQDAIFLFREQLASQFFTPDTCSFNIIIKGLCRLGDTDGAFEFFKEMRDFGCTPDTVTHNILVDGLCQTQQVDRGHEMLRRIQSDGLCVPNVVTYTSVISGYCKMGKMEEALEVFNEMIELGIRPSRVTYNVLIDGFGKAGDMPSAVSMYERMMVCGCPPDVVTFTSLIDGYSRSEKLDDALRLWNEMGQRGIRPNAYTFAIVISSLCKKNRISEASHFLKELSERRDIVPHAFIYNFVIDVLCKVGNLDEANILLLEMEEKRCSPDKFTFTSLIIGHCMKGRMVEAIGLFHKMVATGCAPDSVTVSSLVSCLLKAGLPNEVNRIMLIASGRDLGLDISSSKESPSSLGQSPDITVAM